MRVEVACAAYEAYFKTKVDKKYCEDGYQIYKSGVYIKGDNGKEVYSNKHKSQIKNKEECERLLKGE